MKTWVIISCGKSKRAAPAPAAKLYTGGYFKSLLAYALTKTDGRHVLILSAKYGLVTLDTILQPYDLKMGQPGSVTAEVVRVQAGTFGILTSTPTVLVSGRYRSVLRLIWPGLQCELENLPGGMGVRLQYLRSHT